MKCILHIGTEKTASTTIQNWLYLNKERLSQQGIALSDYIGKPNNRMLCSFYQNEFDDFFYQNKIKNSKEKDIFFSGFLEKLSDEISYLAMNHDYMIISSEHFHSRLKTVEEIASLKAFLLDFFSEIRVVCYFREQSAVRRSLYSTMLKGDLAIALDDFQSDIDDSSIYYNYYLMFSQWESVFGKDSLVPLIFHKNYFHGFDIRKDFIKKSIHNIDVESLIYRKKDFNVQLSQLQTLFFRAINSMGNDISKDYGVEIIAEIKQSIYFNKQLCVGEIIDLIQLDIWHRFNESNVNFFEHYFGIPQNLFSPPKMQSMDHRSDSVLYANQDEIISGINTILKIITNKARNNS